eukprot:gene15705-2025_t
MPRVLQWRPKAGGPLRTEVHHVFSSDQKQDAAWVLASDDLLHKLDVWDEFKHLHRFFDNASHFKGRSAFYNWATLPQRLGLKGADGNFFCAGHGKGLHDALGGGVHRVLRAAINRGDSSGRLPFRNAKEVVAWLKANRKELRYEFTGDAGGNTVDAQHFQFLPPSTIAKVRNEIPDTEEMTKLPGTRHGVYQVLPTGKEGFL